MKKAALSLTMLLLSAAPSFACPSCKEAVAQDPAGARLTQGFSRSIYLMMGTPYLVFGGLTLMIVRAARRNRKQRA